jgi:hypothetical protein
MPWLKPTDESFMEIWDFLGLLPSRSPLFLSVTSPLGLYTTPKDISIPTLLGQMLLMTTLPGPRISQCPHLLRASAAHDNSTRPFSEA